MATIREGDRCALLVVDVQVGVVRDTWDAERVVGNVAGAVERARAGGVPVVWVQHNDDELPEGSDDWQWAPPLSPAPGETLIHKHFNSSFEETCLDDELARLSVSHIVLAGTATNWCIRATAYGALDRGYDLTLVSDAHTTETMEFTDGTTVEAADVVRDLNTTMQWVSYPGRKSAVAPAADVDFGSSGRTG